MCCTLCVVHYVFMIVDHFDIYTFKGVSPAPALVLELLLLESYQVVHPTIESSGLCSSAGDTAYSKPSKVGYIIFLHIIHYQECCPYHQGLNDTI